MQSDVRLKRRMLGVLAARLPEAELGEVQDPRDHRGRRRPLETLLTAVVVGVVAGCKSLLHAEALTAEMAPCVRKRLGLPGRIPDTTIREALVKLSPPALRGALHRQVKAAVRRKALEPVGLPFGVLTVDGKGTSTTATGGRYAQTQSQADGGSMGIVRTLTFSLVSSAAKVCMDAVPIPAWTNEMGHFLPALRSVLAAYGRCRPFRLVTYDAGGCSEENGRTIVALGLDYLFGLKGSQPTLRMEAERLLAAVPVSKAEAETIDVLSNKKTVTRRLYSTSDMSGFLDWDHLDTVFRVESVTEVDGVVSAYENRYFICSLPRGAMTSAQWLLAIRRHWAVENNCHHTWDAVFEEDDHPWIEQDPQGMIAMFLLRRVAYNILALFRSVTQRSEERRATPWRDLIRWMRQALESATLLEVAGLRCREVSAVAP